MRDFDNPVPALLISQGLGSIAFIHKMRSQEKSKNLSMEFFSDDVKIIISVLRKEARLHAQNDPDRLPY